MLAKKYPGLNVFWQTRIGEYLSRTELPRSAGFDQQLLRDLRTPDLETNPASA